ncbi:MAG TPA: exodeoxyribonuclease VII small subunit [Desulfonatronum sp.]|nr:exodeoxyribonuclease VII small subunit [Desulfonatronum sp.]
MTAKKKEPGFDDKLAELQRIVAKLENEDLPLETGVALFKDGVALSKACRQQLETAKNEVMICSKGLLEPFAAEETGQNKDMSADHGDEGLPF